ncbi:IclR family transcriptional regulator [Knoellia koreensis]|uniref:Glycerol operon regulatory protein n=1 Tax=Knoellia koreensis TaxID=2730921 RepID=A0A849HE89_9MICO|nr:IclR family transcriptional regulator [Knoellia sp. DB2414S]NNM45602.1 IclR family transcriptional regulator [Knoellia sp. DB2414S]
MSDPQLTAGGVADRGAPHGGLQSLATSLDLLDCFADAESLGVSQVARQLGVSKSSAHRMLTTMGDRGFVERDEETGRYRLGMRLYELGQAAAARSKVRRLAMPLLEDLRRRTGQTVHLAVPDGGEVVYLARLSSGAAAHQLGQVGLRFPAHTTGSGKVIAAFDPAVAAACRVQGFRSFTPSSIRSSVDFDRALVDIRRRGYAVNDQETVHGMTTVAAAVSDHTGVPRAALSLVGESRLVSGHIADEARLVTAAANKLARVLGL